MKKVLILGANGRIARLAEKLILKETNYNLVLFLRNPERLAKLKSRRVKLVEGDVSNVDDLVTAMEEVDIVCASLTGEVDKYAENIVKAMNSSNINRLIWVSPVGIYDEIPGKFGEWNKKQLGNVLEQHKKAAAIIESARLNFTILRIAWPADYPEIIFKVVQKDEKFEGTVISRKSVAALIEELVEDTGKHSRKSVGIYKPYTQGDKPAWL